MVACGFELGLLARSEFGKVGVYSVNASETVQELGCPDGANALDSGYVIG